MRRYSSKEKLQHYTRRIRICIFLLQILALIDYIIEDYTAGAGNSRKIGSEMASPSS